MSRRKRAVIFEIEQIIENQIDILGLTVRRKPHQFVFARIHFETGVIRERRIEQAERMRKIDFPLRREFIALAEPDSCSSPTRQRRRDTSRPHFDTGSGKTPRPRATGDAR